MAGFFVYYFFTKPYFQVHCPRFAQVFLHYYLSCLPHRRHHLMRNRGRVVPRLTILEHVWDYSFDPHTNVVETRVSRLRAKLGTRTDGKPFIRTVKGFGYAID